MARLGEIRPGQTRLGQIRPSQTPLGQTRLGQAAPAKPASDRPVSANVPTASHTADIFRDRLVTSNGIGLKYDTESYKQSTYLR